MLGSKILRRISAEVLAAKKEYDLPHELTNKSPNLYTITAYVKGPEGSAFENGLYEIEIEFDTTSYPFKPPNVRFMSPIHHPNINGQRICVDFLQSQWSPALTIVSVIKSLELLLLDPNPDSPLNSEAAGDFRNNHEAYKAKNQQMLKKHSTTMAN